MDPIQPRELDEIFDHFAAFKNIRNLWLSIFGTNFINRDFALTSRCFPHFQPTLRSLKLTVPTNNLKDLIAFIAFFPLLEEVSIFFLQAPRQMADSQLGELDPNRLNPLRGSLRIYDVTPDSGFTQELAKVRVQYHTLELFLDPASSETGLQALLTACAPTLRVLQLPRPCMSVSPCWR
jgi:hypothetical protein